MKIQFRKLIIHPFLYLTLIALSLPTQAGFGNDFVFAQLKHGGLWDPYPTVHEPILTMIRDMTNIPFVPERQVVTLTNPDLFQYPFLIIKGSESLQLNKEEKKNLKAFIDQGGFVLIDDTVANSQSPFSQSIRKIFSELYPDRPFARLSLEHALFRSFFLLRSVGGRRINNNYLEGIEVGGHIGGEGRTAVLYCPNDLLGVWVKDRLGNYSFTCEPGGEAQRWESFKLTLNIIYFSLTGTYKKDAIHQPFIEKKLGT